MMSEIPGTVVLSQQQEEIELPVKFVDNGSKVLKEKLQDKEFRKKVEDCVNRIWDQVKIRFKFSGEIETLDKKSKKDRFEHHDKEKSVIHIFLTSGNTADTTFKDEENPRPKEGIAAVGDGRFKESNPKSPDPDSKEERTLTDLEALCETISHELGHLLGLRDVDTKHVPNSWNNLMWTNRNSRMGTELGKGPGDLRNDQESRSRQFAQDIAGGGGK